MQNKKINLERREFLKTFCVAGLGTSLISLNSSAYAELSQIKYSKFDYKFKTFRPDEIIKIGMIGTDGHTGTILGDLPSIKNVKLVAYANHNNRIKNLPKEVKLYDNYEEMLEKEELDIVGVCLPYYLNAKASIALAKKKIHIITEKPIATTLEDLNTLLKAVIENKVRLTCLFDMRFSPSFQTVHKAVVEGKIGEPILITAQKSYKFGESRPDFYKKAETYGGTIPWVGIHAIDYIHYTTRLDYSEVVAFQGNKDHPEYPGLEDYVGVLLRLSNNGTALINIDYLRPETAPTHGDDRLRIIGSEGVIEIKDLGERVELITSSSKPVNLPLTEGKSLMGDFISELRGEGKHILLPEEPFEMTRVALIAHQSANQKRIVKL